MKRKSGQRPLYTDEILQEFFSPDAVYALRERDGKLYVSENWLSRQTARR